MAKGDLRFDIEVIDVDTGTKMKLRKVSYEYFIKAFSEYNESLEANIKDGTKNKSYLNLKKGISWNPLKDFHNN